MEEDELTSKRSVNAAFRNSSGVREKEFSGSQQGDRIDELTADSLKIADDIHASIVD